MYIFKRKKKLSRDSHSYIQHTYRKGYIQVKILQFDVFLATRPCRADTLRKFNTILCSKNVQINCLIL